jgi:hypothetical protein
MRHIDDPERIEVYTRLMAGARPPDPEALSERERRLLMMLHADLWGTDKSADTLAASLERLWRHDAIRDELRQLLDQLRAAVERRPGGAGPGHRLADKRRSAGAA